MVEEEDKREEKEVLISIAHAAKFLLSSAVPNIEYNRT